MKISNKLSTDDFIELQKIVMERHDPGMGTTFVLKYMSNFLYSVVIFLGFYYILSRYAGLDNWIIPAIAGILAFILLILFFPKFYRRRVTRVIEKFYAKSDINIERDLILDDEGFSVTDDKGERRFAWKDFESIVRSAGNYFLKLRGKAEGFVIKADHLQDEEVTELEDYLVKSGQSVEEKNNEK